MLLFLNLGGGEIFVIVLVILLFFGSKSIPEIAKGLGKGIREFKDAANNIQREINTSSDNVTKEVTEHAQEIGHEIKAATDSVQRQVGVIKEAEPEKRTGDTE